MQVADTLPYAIILGLDVLQAMSSVIDFKTNTISFPESIPIELHKQCAIPAKTEMHVIAKLACPLDLKILALVHRDLHRAMATDGVIVARTVLELGPHNQTFPLQLFNTSDQTISLQEGYLLGYAELLGSDQIMPFNANIRSNESMNFMVPPNESQPDKDFTNLFDMSESIFDENQQKQLLSLLWTYKDVFKLPGEPLGCTDVIEHHIELEPGSVPYKAPLYRSNPKVRTEIETQVKSMLDQGIISPSVSPYSSPIVMVKRNGKYRLANDNRIINSKTVKDNYPIGCRPDDAIESLGASGAKIFSLLDMESGFWQIKVAEDSKQYTSFLTHFGAFHYNRMNFGLTNAPATFARLMQRVLEGLCWATCLVYLDDIICFSADFRDHLIRLAEIFQRFRVANLKLKPSKCIFGRDKIKFLGFIVSENGVQPAPDLCKAVETFPTPTSVKQVRSFLGLSGFYRKFIKDYAKIASPLTDSTKSAGSSKFVWTKECQEAFDTLKKALTTYPTLAYPMYDKDYILYCDSSGKAVGMVLAQIQEGVERVIAYGGKKLSPTEQNYPITELECLAVILAVRHFDPYLRQNKFTIVTDHSALTWLLKKQAPLNGRLARWVTYLQQFNFDIVHRPGNKIANADGLSRREYSEDRQKTDLPNVDDLMFPADQINAIEECLEGSSLEPAAFTNNPRINRPDPEVDLKPPLSLSDIRKLQLQDKHAAPFISFLEKGSLPNNTREARSLILQSESYEIIDGVLYHIWYPDGLTSEGRIQFQLVVPDKLVHDVLQSFHGDLGSGHFGINRTYQTMKLKYFWKGMLAQTENWVKSCTRCEAKKSPPKSYRAELQPLPPAAVNERYGIDLVGPLPTSLKGNKYIVVFTEYCTRYAEAFALPDAKAHTIAKVFCDEICMRYGSPKYLLSDLGSNLLSQVMAETCQYMGTSRLVTSPYHPQTNSLTEKFNGTLTRNLAKVVSKSQKDWCGYLKCITYAYCTSVCVDSTNYSPFYLMYGREPRNALQTVLPQSPQVSGGEGHDFLKNLIERLLFAKEIAKSNLQTSASKMKFFYDLKKFIPEYKVGDRVWIYFPQVKVGQVKKLFSNFSGPYILTQQISPVNFKAVRAYDHKPLKHPVHVNRCKPFIHRTIVPPSEEELEGILNTVSGDSEECVNVEDIHELDAVNLRENEIIEITDQSNDNLDENTNDIDTKNNNDVDNIDDNISINNEVYDGDLHAEVSASDNLHSSTISNSDIERAQVPVCTDLQGKGSNVHDVNEIDDIVPQLGTEQINNTDDVIVDSPQSSNNNFSPQLRRSNRKPRPRYNLKDILADENSDENSHPERNPPEFPIEKIIKGRYNKDGKLEYLIHWANYPASARSYEPYENLNDEARHIIASSNVPIIGKSPK